MDLKGKCDVGSAFDPNVSFTAYPHSRPLFSSSEVITLSLNLHFISEEDSSPSLVRDGQLNV